jgi:hypothetical protein
MALEVELGRFRIDMGGLGIAMPLLLRYSIWGGDGISTSWGEKGV